MPLAAGTKVDAEQNGVWYQAVIKQSLEESSGLSYKVHYHGWNARCDEWVDSARVRGIGSFSAGDEVQARDRFGKWYGAKIVHVTEDGEYRVHFLGWAARWDETVPADRVARVGAAVENMEVDPEAVWGGAAGHLGDDQFQVHAVLKSRIREGILQYWVDWGPEWDLSEADMAEGLACVRYQWVDEDDIDPALVESFVPSGRGRASGGGTPFVMQDQLHVTEDVAAQLVGSYRNELARHMFRVLDKQRGHLKKYVSEITALRGGHGGKHIEDSFKISSQDIVDEMIRPFLSSVVKKQENGTLMLLVPPLEFRFRTQRVGADEPAAATQLIVTGHFFSLATDRIFRWARPGNAADGEFYSPQVIHGYKKALAHHARNLPAGQVSADMLQFLQPL
ncbi:hypothetical protein EMIHUDRAFT_108556 [Emiliania huxleyi CCMP1516]|uniref:Tudor-knot domain-containing protein n=2 Tax=Emiliania huxleyi TaxID=2903 RepID=A0A0D3KX76_EMIH1|nr:hypothetical protein EMIHUDRAFT_108556 [Emiliania huxleyi CCMP1516]EOD40361.1 hypothetical protein EMIHUDRAFT_108556 [Emiliania huxleyi CCMP1516]|eukprot:XP_005792790.1 hypothetical protein EMIHUDRAFT_108556 [Emiliania huxleyi CCMP1516]